MNKNEFFREATLKICGNLEIEKALRTCILILQKVMPIDRLFLQQFDQGFGAMRTIATATLTECSKMDQLTPLSEEARESVSLKNFPNEQDIFIFNDPDKYAISREMLQFHRVPCSSLMVMLIRSNDHMLGSLVAISEGDTKFATEHAGNLTLIKEPFAIAMSNTLKHREIQKLKDLLADDNRYLQGELHRRYGDEIVGAKYGLKEVMNNIQQVARLDSPVLLLGETGAGKDVIANTIHYSSTRKDGPFVSVNCGAIPDTLIDSELFGHEKGAFTGALSQKRGRFERAHNGTIFLDEIGELPLPAQVRLLKVLQDKEIERVGGTKTISLDIRIIAATNRNLQEMVSAKQFREDLWFRLNVFPIWIPPLRERKPDIPALLQHFMTLKAKELKLPDIPTLAPDAIDVLMNYDWPGNVRELQNVVERALILNPLADRPLSFEHLTDTQQHTSEFMPAQSHIESNNLDDIISHHIRQVLVKTDGKIHGPGGAAELLGINANTLRNRMNKLGIEYGKSRRLDVQSNSY